MVGGGQEKIRHSRREGGEEGERTRRRSWKRWIRDQTRKHKK